MTIQSLARKREIFSSLFPFTESFTYMVANCGEWNLMEKAPNTFCKSKQIPRKKLLTFLNNIWYLKQIFHKIDKLKIINESCWMPQADVRALPESSLLRCFVTAFTL